MKTSDIFTLAIPNLRLVARLIPWDTVFFGFTVGQIDTLECPKPHFNSAALHPFFQWLDQNVVRLVSCRLPCDRLVESMLLEECGFKFVETVLHPYLNLPVSRCQDEDELVIAPATLADIPVLETIAANAFTTGRIHVDPRLGPTMGDRRYSRWVTNCLDHPSQRLFKVTNAEDMIIGLFITEAGPDQSMYWHLTAIAPECQGQGYGWRVWRAMLTRHTQEGMRSVSTTITARNIPVLNLYAKLGFRFLPPEITFHWIRETER